VIAKSEKGKGQPPIALSENEKMPSVITQSPSSIAQFAFAKLTWTHFVRLLSVKNDDERNFYLIETAENNCSV
jgi:hypothetical protein